MNYELECVSSGDDQFVVGQRYQIIKSLGRGMFVVANKQKYKVSVHVQGQKYKFRLSWNKPLTPRMLGCFDEVSEILGEERAEYELYRVIDQCASLTDEDYNPMNNLLDCFDWSESPQGHDYWMDVYNGVVPKSQSIAIEFAKNEMLKSYCEAIREAGGDVELFIEDIDTMTVGEMINRLAQNDIRFTYTGS
jgi:hypothetical protein